MLECKLQRIFIQKCEEAMYNESTFIPLFAAPTTSAMKKNVQDSGKGNRGQSSWINPESVLPSK
jgi:hypothetical protein